MRNGMARVMLASMMAMALCCAATMAAPTIAASPTSLDFGDVALGDSAELELTIQNIGDEPLIVSSVASDDPAFVPDETSFVIAAGEDDVVVVTFTPAALGDVAGTLTLSSDDPVTPELAVPLSATSTTLGAEVDVNPDTLNTRSRGRYMTVYIELPAGMDPNDIDPTTVTLTYGGTVLTALAFPPPGVEDYDLDTVDELMVKFSRRDLIAAVSGGGNQTVELSVAGVLQDGTAFDGTDSLRVLDRGSSWGGGGGGRGWGWWSRPTEPRQPWGWAWGWWRRQE